MIDRTFVAMEESANLPEPPIRPAPSRISPAFYSFLHFLAGLIADEIINQSQTSELETNDGGKDRITTLPD